MISLWHLTWIIPAAMCGGALIGAFLVILVQAIGETSRKEEKRE